MIEPSDTHPARKQIAIVSGLRPQGTDASDDSFVETLSTKLASAGHDVAIVQLDAAVSSKERARGVRGEVVSSSGTPPIHVPEHRVTSFRLYAWLKEHPFDVVHFPELDGSAYYSVLAKRQGIAFDQTVLAVHAGNDAASLTAERQEFPEGADTLEVEFMERESLRLADAVTSTGEEWLSWHDAIVTAKSARNKKAAKGFDGAQTLEAPLVSVCVTMHDRHEFLPQALASIEAQIYRNFEIVLVDDGSTDPDAVALLDELGPRFEDKGWTLVRQDNLYLGAARNRALRHARGDYVLFLDDDDVLRPELLSTLVAVATRTGADILSTCVDFFSSPHAPSPTETPEGRWLPLGGATEAGAFRNVFGAATSLIRKKALVKLGGYSEDFGVGFEDWELYARAALAGCEIQVVPEFLFWYRKLPGGMLETTPPFENRSRVLRPYRASGRAFEGILGIAVRAEIEREARASQLEAKNEELRVATSELSEARRTIDALNEAIERRRRQELSDVDIVIESARLLAELGESEASTTTLRALASVLERADIPAVTAQASSDGASVLAGLGDFDGAREWSDRAQGSIVSVDDPSVALRSFSRRAETLAPSPRAADVMSARACISQAKELATALDDAVANVELGVSAGKTALAQGDTASAWRSFREAATASREQGYGKLLAECLILMAPLAIHHRKDEEPDAVAHVLEAIGVARETKSARLLISVMYDAVSVLQELGRPEASSVLASARTLARQTGNALAWVSLTRLGPPGQMDTPRARSSQTKETVV